MTEQEPTVSQPDVAALAEELAEKRRTPGATYRIQFHPGFDFEQARAIVGYLRELGISELYASPLFAARAGSTHGYDVADYGKLNPALGGDEPFQALSQALREAGLGLILDMVPNHMGIGDANPWWMDVLENGPASPYAQFFDIDWEPVKPELAGKVLLPILGDQYGIVLENGELSASLVDGAITICYYDTRLPADPQTMLPVLETTREAVSAALPEDDAERQELESIITALGYLPPRTETDPERLAERRREKEIIRRRLVALCEKSGEVCRAVEQAVATLNGTKGDPRSFDALDALIERQPYRLAYWRVAAEEINYRRFFDINDLAAVRVERPEVFAAAHELVFRLIGDGSVSGLRIDHPDGMWDPPAYFAQLQERFVLDEARRREPALDEPAALEAAREWSRQYARRTAEGQAQWPLYVVAEKILSESEPLPPDWAVDGTTGYDFLNLANGIFVAEANGPALDEIYRRFIHPENPAAALPFAELVRRAKGEIMEGNLASEITSLSHQLERITEKNRRSRDFTLRGISDALTAILAELGIYRTYITEPGQVSERDIRYVLEAVHAARRRHPHIPNSLFTFLRDTMLLRNLEQFREEDRQGVVDVIMRLQQMTGPVMAKSVEDTAFYRYHRLVSLNEVGGHPEQFGHGVAEFHRRSAERVQIWPHAMLTLATHDTKRGEDVRARINVLSELPEEWAAAVTHWAELNAAHKRQADGEAFPDRGTEYLLYQTLVGMWPDEEEGRLDDEGRTALVERVVQYMQKATREAKLYTSWINPNEEYDAAIAEFVQAVLDPARSPAFLAELDRFARRVAGFGRVNSLAQTLLKLASPGVPDTYQGTELWDLSLVDPDNRRPVDYDLRRRYLAELRERTTNASARAELAAELLQHSRDGRIKLYLVSQVLAHRQANPQIYAEGGYTALEASGAQAAHLCGFARPSQAGVVIAVVPRLVAGLSDGEERTPIGDVWGDTALQLPQELRGRYRDLLTGRLFEPAEQLPLAELLSTLPLALLERIG